MTRPPNGSAWRIEITDVALRRLEKLDRATRAQVFRYLRERIATPEDPRRFGKALRGRRVGF